MTVVFFEKVWRSALDADISWVTGRPQAGWWAAEARRTAGTVAAACAAIAGVVVAVLLIAGPLLGPGSAGQADQGRRAAGRARPAAATTTLPPMQLPPPLALALECGSVEHAAQMACLGYLAGIDQATLDGLGFFCANDEGDPAACRARRLAMQLRSAA